MMLCCMISEKIMNNFFSRIQQNIKKWLYNQLNHSVRLDFIAIKHELSLIIVYSVFPCQMRLCHLVPSFIIGHCLFHILILSLCVLLYQWLERSMNAGQFGTNCFDQGTDAQQFIWNGSRGEQVVLENGERKVWVENGTLWTNMGTKGLAQISNSWFRFFSVHFTFRNIVMKRVRKRNRN